MDDKKDGIFSIICSMFLLFGGMLFKSTWTIVIVSIILLLYGILKIVNKRGKN